MKAFIFFRYLIRILPGKLRANLISKEVEFNSRLSYPIFYSSTLFLNFWVPYPVRLFKILQ